MFGSKVLLNWCYVGNVLKLIGNKRVFGVKSYRTCPKECRTSVAEGCLGVVFLWSSRRSLAQKCFD